jgi:hypothetical protein
MERLLPALSAKERGKLVLRSLKDGTRENPHWRRTMPPGQQREFNQYIGLMNAANIQLAMLITVLEHRVEELGLRYLVWWQMKRCLYWRAEVELLVTSVVREPVTETELKQLVATNMMRYMPLAEAASLLASEQRNWSEDDLKPLGSQGEPIVKEKSWQRCRAEAGREIRRAVKAGELEAKGAGKSPAVRAGALDDWLGRPLTLYPEWASWYLPLPDDRAEEVARDRASLQRLQRLLATAPLLGVEQAGDEDAVIESVGKTLEASAASLRTELRLVDLILDEISEHFDGEDVLRPQARKPLEDTREALTELTSVLYDGHEAPPLVEPTPAEVNQVRLYLDRQKRLFAETVN